MPHTLTDDPSVYPNPIQVPSDGDLEDSGSVQTPFQQLANRIAWIKDYLIDGNKNLTAITKKLSVTVQLLLGGAGVFATGGSWALTNTIINMVKSGGGHPEFNLSDGIIGVLNTLLTFTGSTVDFADSLLKN